MSSSRRAIRQAVPTFEPVTLAQAKAQLRIATANTDHDSYITRLIQEAREKFEHDSSYVIATGSFVLSLDSFEDDDIDLPLRPITAITSITYKDVNGDTQTFSSTKYTLSNSEAMPEIVLNYNESWPSVRGHRDDITITFVAGHATAGDVPEKIKQAVLLEIKQQFEAENVADMKENFGYEVLLKHYMRPTYP